jgi:hypothetical protein
LEEIVQARYLAAFPGQRVKPLSNMVEDLFKAKLIPPAVAFCLVLGFAVCPNGVGMLQLSKQNTCPIRCHAVGHRLWGSVFRS